MVKRRAARLADGYRTLSRQTRIFLTALLLLICLGGGYYGVREVALRNADQLTVSVTRLGDGPDGRAGSLIYQQVFGRALAAEAEHLLNDETNTGYVGTSLPSSAPARHYHLSFTWQGILVETADVSTMTYPEVWSISALGLPDLQDRSPKVMSYPYTYDSSIIYQLYVDSGGAIP